MKKATIILLLTLCISCVGGQACPSVIYGAWTSDLEIEKLLTLNVGVFLSDNNQHRIVLAGAQKTDTIKTWQEGQYLRWYSGKFSLAFRGQLSQDRQVLNGFIDHGSTVSRAWFLTSEESSPIVKNVDWSPLSVHDKTSRLDLYIEDEGNGNTGGYFFFRDQRLPGLFGEGVQCSRGELSFGERNLKLRFTGKYDAKKDQIVAQVAALGGTADMVFTRIPQEEIPSPPNAPIIAETAGREPGPYAVVAPTATEDGWPTSAAKTVGIKQEMIAKMVNAIHKGEMALTHSVLISKNGKLVVEEYFHGYDQFTVHDMRSSSKSLASTLVGLAIQAGYIDNAQVTALSLLPDYRQLENWDSRKSQITLQHLMTMSSGLDADDSRWESYASEGRYQFQSGQPDWSRFAFDAPMIADPGKQPLYGSANPLIVGRVLQNALDEPVEWFADRHLFARLGITSYSFVVDPAGVVYMGGGVYLRPRDMLKIGQLYLDDGRWRGKQILAKSWIDESFASYGRLAPLDRNGHQYGYLWWHHKYEVAGKTISTREARGNGGQYIFVIPELEAVVVITGGNYFNRRTRQPETILQQFILPAMLN